MIPTQAGWALLLMGGSLLMLLGTLFLIPLVIARLPVTYFEYPHYPLEKLKHRPFLRIALLILKNLMGLTLMASGFAMLVLPGQGLLTLFLAIILLDFPGKSALKRKLIASTRLRSLVNQFRVRHGKAPFSFHEKPDDPHRSGKT
jgi:hypothetical protein